MIKRKKIVNQLAALGFVLQVAAAVVGIFIMTRIKDVLSGFPQED